MQRIVANDNFASIIEESNQHLDFLRRIKNWVFAGVQKMEQHFIFNFQGLTKDKFSLSDEGFNETECVQMWRDNLYLAGVATYNIFKSQILFFYGDYANALKWARASQETIVYLADTINVAENCYYYSLILTALYPTASEAENCIPATNSQSRDRLQIVRLNCARSSQEIREAVIDDVRRHIGEQKVFDDITLLVIKQK